MLLFTFTLASELYKMHFFFYPLSSIPCLQGNTPDELPEQLIGAVRISHVELSSAVVPVFDATPAAD